MHARMHGRKHGSAGGQSAQRIGVTAHACVCGAPEIICCCGFVCLDGAHEGRALGHCSKGNQLMNACMVRGDQRGGSLAFHGGDSGSRGEWLLAVPTCQHVGEARGASGGTCGLDATARVVSQARGAWRSRHAPKALVDRRARNKVQGVVHHRSTSGDGYATEA